MAKPRKNSATFQQEVYRLGQMSVLQTLVDLMEDDIKYLSQNLSSNAARKIAFAFIKQYLERIRLLSNALEKGIQEDRHGPRN